ncbi:MAG: peptidase M28, partial [Alteraurantiacibacter sp.]|nr:peptidase M28 [Alteraurantiacibacter sp.]
MPATVPATGDIPLDRWQNLARTLSSDEFEGRAPGTRGEELTLAALATAFADAGLQPGNNGSWFQDVPLVEITGHSHAPLVVRAAQGPAHALAFGDDWVGVTYREAEAITLPPSAVSYTH